MILLKDIFRALHPSGKTGQYGKKGERLKLIADHGIVLIVEGQTASFPVKISDVQR